MLKFCQIFELKQIWSGGETQPEQNRTGKFYGWTFMVNSFVIIGQKKLKKQKKAEFYTRSNKMECAFGVASLQVWE